MDASNPGVWQKEPSLIVGLIMAAATAALTLLGAGELEDGLQWPDVVAILIPILGALGIRAEVYSPATVARERARGAQTVAPAPR